MYTMTNPIQIPNINRVRVTKVQDNPDDDEPNAVVQVELVCVGGAVYGPPDGANCGTSPWFVKVTNASATCQGLNTKATPLGLHDLIAKTTPGVTGAYTAMIAAMDAVSGRANKREAAENYLASVGVFGAGLAKAPA